MSNVNYTVYEGMHGYNVYNGTRSVRGTVENDFTTAYCMRSLYQRVYAGFRPHNPKTWNERYFKNVLLTDGYLSIFKTAKYGIVPQISTPTGERGLFLEPTEMLASQPLVHQQSIIGEDVEVIHLTPDWCGVWDIIEHWALRLSMAFTSLDVALINSRAAIMAAAKNKSAQETLKALYEKLTAGESLLVYDKAMKSESLEESEPIWTQAIDVKNNYIVTDLLADIQTIVNDFDREIGIAAIGQKKERMITDEVAQLTADSAARSDCWFECLSRSYDKVNELFPELDLSFEMTYGGELHSYVKGEFTNG